MNVLEEGLACCFQHDYMQSYPGFDVPQQYMTNYILAETLARGLLQRDADVIQKARQAETVIARIDADTLVACCPALPLEEAQVLAERFYRESLTPNVEP